MDVTVSSEAPKTFRLVGRLTFKDNDAFNAILKDVSTRPSSETVLDLAGLDFVDSFGIGLFLVAAETAAKVDGRLKVRSPQGTVKRLFALANLGSVLTVEGDAPPVPSSQPPTGLRHGLWTSPPIESEGDTVTVELGGRFTYADNAPFEELMRVLTKCAYRTVRLGLSALDFMDSAGLSMLLLARDVLDESGTRLQLVSPRGKVAHLLRLAAVDRVTQIIDAPPAPGSGA